MASVRKRNVTQEERQGTLSRSTSLKKDGKVVDGKARSNKFDVGDLPDHPAYMILKKGETIPQPDYASFRVDVSISMPTGISDEDMDKTKDRLSELVDGYLEEEISDFLESQEQ